MMNSTEVAQGIRSVTVRRAQPGCGAGTLPYLRARANELVFGPEYLLTQDGDGETLWECTFRRQMWIPNRQVLSWGIFVPSNECDNGGYDTALAVRASLWRTDQDLRAETWKTTDQPSVESRLGVFSNSLTSTVRHLDELDRLICDGVRLDPRKDRPAWEEQTIERVFASGTFRLTIGRDVSNNAFEQALHSICDGIEVLLDDPSDAKGIDSMDIVFPGS